VHTLHFAPALTIGPGAFYFNDLTTQGLAREVFMEPGTRSNGPASLQLVRMVGIDDSVTEGLLEVKSVKTVKPQRHQGHASRLLEQVCEEADKNGTLLVLTPEQFDNGPIGSKQLQDWYERFGFAVIQDRPVLMCRDPVVSVH
jgi:GNAT superfamily N-acetyltransferase